MVFVVIALISGCILVGIGAKSFLVGLGMLSISVGIVLAILEVRSALEKREGK